LEPATRKLLCACEACGILFSVRGLSSRYVKVPVDSRFLEDFQMTDAEWDSLMIPISMAFFYYSTPAARVIAAYPSPAGATESLLSLDTWERLAGLEPDVEALLVNRVGQKREYYIAPIDQCYKLVGLIRTNWRGFSGGSEVWDKINAFFAALKEQSHA
jgi:hypothetical protein